MAKVTGQQAGEAWRRGMANATERIRSGINSVNVSPTEMAAQNVDKQVAGVQRAAASGKTAAALRRVTLADWKRAAIEKGLPRIAQGAAAAEGKFAQFATELLAYQDRGLPAIKAMPDLTIDDAIQRSAAWIRYMSEFRRSS